MLDNLIHQEADCATIITFAPQPVHHPLNLIYPFEGKYTLKFNGIEKSKNILVKDYQHLNQLLEGGVKFN